MYLLLLSGLFILSFMTGLSGALSPGSLLVVTIDSSLRKGWSGGVLTVFGHVLVEAPLIVALAYGVGSVMNNESIKLAVTLIGGCALLAFGSYTVYSSRHAELTKATPVCPATYTPTGHVSTLRPVLSGLIATTTNPFYWIWWATIGLAMLTYAPLLVMANINPLIYWASLGILFNALSTFLGKLSYLLYAFASSPLLPQFSLQLIDFNYLFFGSTLIGWATIAIGHFLSDITWYTSISVAIDRGRTLLSTKWYQRITLLCGLTLVFLGLWFLASPLL